MEAGLRGRQGPAMREWAALDSRGAPGMENDVRLARRQPPAPLAVYTVQASSSDPLTLNPGYVGRSPRPRGFASPAFGSRLKTNRVAKGSPRASGFLEDAAAPPVKVAVTGAPRESHVFRRGSHKSGALEVTDEPSRGQGPSEQTRYPAARASIPGPPAPAAPLRGGEAERVLEGSTSAPPPTKVSPLRTGGVPAQRDETGSRT